MKCKCSEKNKKEATRCLFWFYVCGVLRNAVGHNIEQVFIIRVLVGHRLFQRVGFIQGPGQVLLQVGVGITRNILAQGGKYDKQGDNHGKKNQEAAESYKHIHGR